MADVTAEIRAECEKKLFEFYVYDDASRFVYNHIQRLWRDKPGERTRHEGIPYLHRVRKRIEERRDGVWK